MHRQRIISVLPPFIQGVTALATYSEYLFGKCNTDFQQMNCSRSISSNNSACTTTTYLLTNSMVRSPSWAVNWFAASQEIPRISRNPKVHYRTHKRPPPVSILGQPNPVHIPTSHLLEIHPYIHPSTPRSPQWSPSLLFPHQDPIDPSLLTHTRHMPSLSHSSRFFIANITDIIRSYELFLIILRFVCCQMYYVLNIFCYKKLNLFEKYLIAEWHSAIYPHNVKRLNWFCSRRQVAVCQSTAWHNHFEDIQFSTSKNRSSWRQAVWFQEMTCATDTLLEHTVHDVSSNRHAGVFVVPVHWQSLAWIWNWELFCEFKEAETPSNPVPVMCYYHQNTFISVMHGISQTGPVAHPASCKGYRVIPGGKAAEAWRWSHTPILCRG